jgi:succinyl-CoA synthetase alpha subunit
MLRNLATLKCTPGAIIPGGEGTAESKMKAMSEAGIHVVKSPAEIGETMAKVLGKT